MLTPFVKWAGGKSQLVDRIKPLMPASYDRYFEPFVGGGALLMAVEPICGCINDINQALINTYKTIRDNPNGLILTVQDLDSILCTKDFYTECRDEYNQRLTVGQYDCRTAALFIYLNKHCFNGLYRVNSRGEFNVPWNNKEQGSSISTDNIMKISEFLKDIEIRCGDFEDAVQGAGFGDFVFIDSPYAPLNNASFDSYTQDRFAETEHRRLANLFQDLTDRGCMCMATNHDTELIRDLYAGFHIQTVPVRRSINADAHKRTGTEVIICNYEMSEMSLAA